MSNGAVSFMRVSQIRSRSEKSKSVQITTGHSRPLGAVVGEHMYCVAAGDHWL